jgi:hypothetical protein
MLRPLHPLWFDHPNNIWRSVQLMKLIIMQSSLASRLFHPLRSKCSLQHAVLKHRQKSRHTNTQTHLKCVHPDCCATESSAETCDYFIIIVTFPCLLNRSTPLLFSGNLLIRWKILMLPWHKVHNWNIVFVCLSVCLSVCVRISSPKLWIGFQWNLI